MIQALLTCLLPLSVGSAWAAETVDPELGLGVLKNEDIHVVQDTLYPKGGKTELGFAVGWMPFDAYTTTPNAQFFLDLHQTESLSISVAAGGGYGLKTKTYRELESPAFGVAPYAYRYLGSALAGVTWAPIYAKMAFGPARVIHYDVYAAARGGATLESSVIPTGGISVAPTASLGVGSRFFLNTGTALRFEVRDDLMLQRRRLTGSTHFKQNVNVQLGISILTGKKK